MATKKTPGERIAELNAQAAAIDLERALALADLATGPAVADLLKSLAELHNPADAVTPINSRIGEAITVLSHLPANAEAERVRLDAIVNPPPPPATPELPPQAQTPTA